MQKVHVDQLVDGLVVQGPDRAHKLLTRRGQVAVAAGLHKVTNDHLPQLTIHPKLVQLLYVG